MNYAFDAMVFAREVHKTQFRKYSGNYYSDHLAEVAGIVATVTHKWPGFEDAMISAAWLHDSVEDVGVQPLDLAARFGPTIAAGVTLLSDLEEGNRAERKALSRQRLAGAPGWVQTVKCADLISNTSSIVLHDPNFAVRYLHEKRQLLEVMEAADRNLWELAMHQAWQA